MNSTTEPAIAALSSKWIPDAFQRDMVYAHITRNVACGQRRVESKNAPADPPGA